MCKGLRVCCTNARSAIGAGLKVFTLLKAGGMRDWGIGGMGDWGHWAKMLAEHTLPLHLQYAEYGF
jgi:hypothetical protein